MSYPGALRRAWIDGRPTDPQQAELRLGEGRLLSGLGLFETLSLREGRALDLDRHLRRIAGAAERISLELPELAAVRARIAEAAAETVGGFGWLKLVVVDGGPWILLSGPLEASLEGVAASAVLLPWRRNPHDPLAGMKSLSYASNLLALKEAKRRGADEGLWLNTRGGLAEGCTSNLFLVRPGRLLTPAVREGVLPGIVREHVLEAASELGLALSEGRVRLRQLERSREAFLTSSLRGVRPLVRVEGRPVGSGRPGPLTARIARRVEAARAREVGLLDSAGAASDI